MTDYDYDAYEPEPLATLEQPRPDAPRRRGCSNLVYNAVTLFFFAASVGVVVLVVTLLRDPQQPFNPFPPGRAEPETGVAALEAGQPESATTPTAEPSVAPTGPPGEPTTEPTAAPPTPTVAPIVRQTASPAAPTPTGAPLDAAPSERLFELAGGEVERRAYTGPERCDYLAVAGEVLDMEGRPVVGIPVVVQGDEFFESLVLSGSEQRYGESGYEVQLGEAPFEAEFTVQLWSDTGFRLSEPVTFETSEDCEENLVVVSFVATQPLE